MSGLTPGRADTAISRLLAPELAEPARIAAPLPASTRPLRVVVAFEDCDEWGRVPQVTDHVTAYDHTSNLEVTATVTALDERAQVLHLEPDWHSVRTLA